MIAYKPNESDVFVIDFSNSSVNIFSFETEIQSICSGYNGSFFISWEMKNSVSLYDFNFQLKDEFSIGSDDFVFHEMIFTRQGQLILYDSDNNSCVSYEIKTKQVRSIIDLNLISNESNFKRFRKFNTTIGLIGTETTLLFNSFGVFINDIPQISDDFYIDERIKILKNKHSIRIHSENLDGIYISFDVFRSRLFLLTNSGDIVQNILY